MTQAMLIILEAGGFSRGGTNFDAKLRRNSTDLHDLFYAHISGMDAFARALVTVQAILEQSPYQQMRQARCASFDSGAGADFEAGKLSVTDLVAYANEHGEPTMRSGQQERYEKPINQYL